MSNVLVKIEEFINSRYKKITPDKYSFHNLKHINRTVDAVKLIGENSGISKSDLEIVLISAWFHDVGILDSYDNHELKSAQIAEKFLSENNYPAEKIKKVVGCIKATNLNTSPKNLLERIIRDADVIHLGKKKVFLNAIKNYVRK